MTKKGRIDIYADEELSVILNSLKENHRNISEYIRKAVLSYTKYRHNVEEMMERPSILWTDEEVLYFQRMLNQSHKLSNDEYILNRHCELLEGIIKEV